MKLNTTTIATIAGAIGGAILTNQVSKKPSTLATAAGIGLGVIVGQMAGNKLQAPPAAPTASFRTPEQAEAAINRSLEPMLPLGESSRPSR
jgi:hypothetical protein